MLKVRPLVQILRYEFDIVQFIAAGGSRQWRTFPTNNAEKLS
jgi:hypothetical protein